MIPPTIATRATRPTVSPTAPPTPSPLFLCELPVRLCESGGIVGVTVTVRTWPVTVSSDVTGVGVHVGVDEVVAEEVIGEDIWAAPDELAEEDCESRMV